MITEEKTAGAKESAIAIAKHNGKTNNPKQCTGYDKIADVFCCYVDAVFTADQSAF